MFIKVVIIPAVICLSKRHLYALRKKSPLGRGNAKGARRGDKNCAAIVITQIKPGARVEGEFFEIFHEDGEKFFLEELVAQDKGLQETIFYV